MFGYPAGQPAGESSVCEDILAGEDGNVAYTFVIFPLTDVADLDEPYVGYGKAAASVCGMDSEQRDKFAVSSGTVSGNHNVRNLKYSLCIRPITGIIVENHLRGVNYGITRTSRPVIPIPIIPVRSIP
jgi:hypothetical protein